ncbi:unnamed protein product [Penicillium salamii]|uniref:Uncharacterized protein n=2 Tax=Penicillium TaxID=5073 RepID=A0A9W4ILC8_9EURO|nr:unnamed protein product [Penicillium salamii]CRL30331.1 unnamed protein product [Penicillium camemberti]CAG7949276.1 unnamed protein product [Penicillium salamii]CAG7957509.1 unnamed protein product [Penicillium salamii]CAG7976935.1 unnamed protein product [Penicillium salamii]
MSTTLPWNPFLVCDIEVSPNVGPGSCCGMTKKGAPCKNSINFQDTKIGHQKLNILTRESFDISTDISTLQSKLCAIAKEFLCARWHQQRQADQLGLQVATPPIVHSRQRQTSSGSSRRPVESDNTDWPPSHGHRQDPPAPLTTSAGTVQSINHFVTAEMLRTNSVSWHVSPTRPAILTSVTNIWAGVQDLSLQNLSLSEDVNEIHCVFCLAEDEDQATERVILRCGQCRAQAHLCCAEEWLGKRRTGFGTSCCVCRNEGSLDALIRPIRVPSASEPSANRETVTVRNSAPNEPRQNQLPQRSMGSPRVSVEQSGLRRSARVAGAHLPRDPSTSAPLRRSARLNPTQRN